MTKIKILANLKSLKLARLAHGQVDPPPLQDECPCGSRWVEYLTVTPGMLTACGAFPENQAKISFNIILLNLAVRIIGIFLLIDLFVFSL